MNQAFDNFETAMTALGIDDSAGDGSITIVVGVPDRVNSLSEDNPADTMVSCEICQTPLEVFEAPITGAETILHSRQWIRYDHDPVPVRVPVFGHVDLQCDFCGADKSAVWQYTGENLEVRTGNAARFYPRYWASCAACAVFIDEQDLRGLVDRHLRTGAIAQGTPASARADVFAMQMKFLGAFLPTITSKKWIGGRRVPAVLNPRMMPRLHKGLFKFWNHPETALGLTNPELGHHVPGVHATGDETIFHARFAPGDQMPAATFERYRNHIISGLEVSELYWVSDTFTQLAIQAGQDFDKLTLQRTDLPAPFGFLVWDGAVGEITRTQGNAEIRALSWTLVPGGVWLNSYIMGEDSDPDIDVETMRDEQGFLLSMNMGAGLPFDTDLSGIKELGEVSSFMLTILSTWFLLAQPGVAEIRTAPVDKRLARGAKRLGTTLPDVKLVDLRRRPRTTQPATTAREGRPLTYRRYTPGHWRDQPYGPGRALRRPIYISPYLTGDESMPLRPQATPTVHVLR